jgi:ketosteroid isomerase-like protein
MKQYLSIILLAGAVACTNANSNEGASGNNASADNNAEQNKAIVTKFMDAELRGDTTAMSALMTDDYIQYGLGVNDNANKAKTLNGVQHHWEVYKYGGKRYKSIETAAMTTTQDGGRGRGKGDWVYLWGDLATDYPSTPDYGNKATTATFAYHAVYRVKNGKIDTRTIYFNHEDIMRQLGYKMISVAEQQKHASSGLVLK